MLIILIYHDIFMGGQVNKTSNNWLQKHLVVTGIMSVRNTFSRSGQSSLTWWCQQPPRSAGEWDLSRAWQSLSSAELWAPDRAPRLQSGRWQSRQPPGPWSMEQIFGIENCTFLAIFFLYEICSCLVRIWTQPRPWSSVSRLSSMVVSLSAWFSSASFSALIL